MLYMKQLYFNEKASKGDASAVLKLRLTNLEIKQWFISEPESAMMLINTKEIKNSESMNMYHHELHKKKTTRSAILTLDTSQGQIKGHKNC